MMPLLLAMIAADGLVVSHPTAAMPGVPTGLPVQVADSLTQPVSGATVCLCQWAPSGDSLLLYAVDTTDGGGSCTFHITPGQTGDVVVTVTKHNYLPYKGYCHVGLFTGDSLATAYNQQRNLARVIGCDTMHLVFTDDGMVLHSVSADGGRSWQQAEAIEQGSFPTICLNYYSGDSTRRAQPWVVYKQGDDIKAALLQPGQPGNVLTIFDGHAPESVPGAPAATEYRPYSTEPQAWVTYAVTYTDGVGNHTYRVYCGRFSALNVYPPDILTPRDKHELSRPSIAVTPGDTVHVVWQMQTTPETSAVMYSVNAGAGWSAPVAKWRIGNWRPRAPPNADRLRGRR